MAKLDPAQLLSRTISCYQNVCAFWSDLWWADSATADHTL